MAQLNSVLNKNEINVLIEAVSDWETLGNQEFHILSMIKKQPVPEENDENHEFIKSLKEHFKRREKEITNNRALRQEQAILIKAKLVLIRQDLGIGELFENSKSSESINQIENLATSDSNLKKRLELAEYYIKDLGVWKSYEEFLKSQDGNSPDSNAKCDGWHHGESE